MALGTVGGAFFTDYLSHVLLSGHRDSFNKYDRKLFLYGTPTLTTLWNAGVSVLAMPHHVCKFCQTDLGLTACCQTV